MCKVPLLCDPGQTCQVPELPLPHLIIGMVTMLKATVPSAYDDAYKALSPMPSTQQIQQMPIFLLVLIR